MAGKPELSTAPSVQNVVVYVSNDNFAQAYTVNNHAPPQHPHTGGLQPPQNGVASNGGVPMPLGFATGAPGASKIFAEKHLQMLDAQQTTGYFTNQAVISHQNGFPQNQAFNHYTNKDTNKYCEEIAVTIQPQRSTKDDYQVPETGYVVMGAETPGTVRSCDSVRSEAAESSCSSLSSAEDGMPNMLVYDSGAASALNVRHGVVVAISGAPIIAAGNQGLLPPPSVLVPHGWKRLVTNGVVIYISPSNAALSSLEHVKDYLLTPETCKCGLECPLKCDAVFNFDPKVSGKAWTFTPDTNNGDLTKLCNHKRKYVQQLNKDCTPAAIKKQKKRKLCGPFTGSVSGAPTILAQQRVNEKINPPLQILQHKPFATKDNIYHPLQLQQSQSQAQPPSQQIVAQAQNPKACYQQQQQQQQHFFAYQNAQQPQPESAPEQLVHPILPNPNISSQSLPLLSQASNPAGLRPQIIGPNGQILIPTAGGNQRVFINGQPSEPSGPGRPLMIPVSISTTPPVNRQEKPPSFIQNGQIYQAGLPGQLQGLQGLPGIQGPQLQSIRHFLPNGFRHQLIQQQQQQQQQKLWNRNINPNSPTPSPVVNNVYERVPPLHQHQPPPNQQMQQVQVQVWQDELSRKKMKTKMKKRYVDQPCPNIDVRQINAHQFPNNNSSSPSFLEDPSGYLAQQTALLNNTINRQTGVNFINTPPQPHLKPAVFRHQIKMNAFHPQPPQIADSASTPDHSNCQSCVVEYQRSHGQPVSVPGPSHQTHEKFARAPGTPDTVTSSNYSGKNSPDSRPIQGGTVSTSNVSPLAIEAEDRPAHETFYIEHPPQFSIGNPSGRSVVTTMHSGRTVGSNTITSVLAGRANTATVSISNPSVVPQQHQQHQISLTARSPLEMVQSVVSSIRPPHSQHNPTISLQNIPQQVVQKGLPPGHILVSSGGQLIMASTNASQPQHQNHHQMPPPPPKLQGQSMPPISVSPMITNVTASVTQMIPAVAQQVLGQQTVLVNALPGSFVLQPGVTMTMDGMNQLQLQPQLVTGNMIHQQHLQPSIVSPEGKNKKGKKRKVPTQTVASMLQIAAQQNSGVVGFPQQLQMHSPQGLTATPVMQALTIVPGKAGTGQFVMNGQMNNQPINLLQPVNLAQGMVQNFPTIQQFVLPTNLAGMVMNADGTATIVQDANIGMQLQLQNVNGQNVLTPVQNNQMFATVGANGQSIIPSGMVIRPQGKIIQQQHSPGAQFLSPTGGGQFVAQFNGQLSPLVASVSPGQQVTFSPQIRPTTVQQPVQQQEFIQCGQTLMVPANIAAAASQAASNQNTTFVQQNTTIVQQQTTIQQQNNQQQQQRNIEQQQQQNIQVLVQQQQQQQQRRSPLQLQQQQQQFNYRNSVSTQTAVNGQTVTTFCQTSTTSAGSPPDTTTLSPLAPGGQSPPTADTTTHTGSTDDGLSPAPSNCSDVVNNLRHSSMAMVHCVSSSEPDSEVTTIGPEFDAWRNVSKIEFADINSKKTTPTRVAYAESSTMMHLMADSMHKRHENVVSTRHLEKPKRKHSDTLIVMETRHSHSLFDDDDDEKSKSPPKVFVEGDLVWGPAKGCPAWPGKLITVKNELVTVRWFGGGEKSSSDVRPSVLQTLSEGLDAHHRASKKSRTGRKLNTQLDKAIQEAMAELDKITSCEPEQEDKKHEKKKTGRLRSSR